MTWFYSQTTGIIRHDEEIVACGYAGNDIVGPYKNCPSAQNIHGHGPLPRGMYAMDTPIEQHPTVGHFAIPLKPSMDNQMFGRSGFYVHGDNPNHPGQSSDGCIVAELETRMRMWSSGDHQIEVTE